MQKEDRSAGPGAGRSIRCPPAGFQVGHHLVVLVRMPGHGGLGDPECVVLNVSIIGSILS